jgi:hypothetical protein
VHDHLMRDRVALGVQRLQHAQRAFVLHVTDAARAVAHRIEPLMTLAQAVRARWRKLAWQLDDVRPRVWRT